MYHLFARAIIVRADTHYTIISKKGEGSVSYSS